MMELFTIKKEVFRPILDSMISLKEDVEIFAMGDSVEVCYVDKTNAALCRMILKTPSTEKTAFKSSIKAWLAIVGSPKEDVVVSLDGNKVNLQWVKKPKVSKSFVTLADATVKSADYAALDKTDKYCTTKVHLDSAHALEFYNLLKAAASASDKDSSVYIFFEKNNDGCFFKDSSVDEYEVKVEDIQVEGENAYSKFSYEYFLGFMSHYKIYDSILLEFGTDCPCKITMENQDVLFNIMVAPRIEGDD